MSTSQRLLVISELLLPTKGGTAVWFSEVYRRLGGKEIHIVTADVPDAQSHDATHPNTIHRLDLRRYGWLRPESLAMYLKLFFKAWGLARRQTFSAVHAGRVLPEGLVGLAVARLCRLPAVIYAHGEEITCWRTPRKAQALSYTFRHADCVIANSEFTRAELLNLGVDANRIVLINPGVDLERYRPDLPSADLRAQLALGSGQKLILSVGRLHRRKGFDQVIRALPGLRQAGLDVHYAIIGIGEDREYFAGVAREAAVQQRVHFLGHVAAEDLPRWYCAADAFAMPNREIDGDTEGFGMVFIEAAACGCPAVAGMAGGTGAAVLDGVTGLRVDGESAAAVAEGLHRILSDDQFASQLGQGGLRRANEDFSWERVAQRTAALNPGASNFE